MIYSKRNAVLIIAFLLAAGLLAVDLQTEIHTARASAAPMPTPERASPPFKGHRGVMIGMSADDVRATLGSPKDTRDEMDFFEISENEHVQVFYAAKTVDAMTVTFYSKLDEAPDCKAVFGEAAEAKSDGSIFKMVRYPKAGFWVSYNHIVGGEPMIMIAIKKM